MPRVVNASGRKPNEIGPNEVYIGNHTRNGWRGSKWGNPYKIDRPGKPRDGTRDEVIAKYRAYILGKPELLAALHELRGKDLMCWCAPERCHGDVLLELANAEPIS